MDKDERLKNFDRLEEKYTALKKQFDEVRKHIQELAELHMKHSEMYYSAKRDIKRLQNEMDEVAKLRDEVKRELTKQGV
jgi:hypothetical protein